MVFQIKLQILSSERSLLGPITLSSVRPFRDYHSERSRHDLRARKGTGDPMGSPAPSPFCGAMAPRTPRIHPDYRVTGRDEEQIDPTSCNATQSPLSGKHEIGDPHGSPPQSAVIPI